ncbi:helix-turn-helix domain-containing protein [Saccharothrix texasensis]|uniref:Helix-turn-helix protein n=1 Tax=Saccharothrix texasensis TaxID=103734 RepID=A0A3N1H438_9PSEU|nr:helix-turn-helix transcriptional regulator [Saccharothrix texasensis]ROP37277.1 helix-turn-helix protein [Saccharothrix texasensis]
MAAKVTKTNDDAIAQRRQVGAAMRSYRKEAGMDREVTAAVIGLAGPTLTRKESGDVQFSRAQIEKLAEAYGVPDNEVAMLIELAREGRARTRSRSGEFPMFVPLKDRAFLELEQRDAIEIMTVTLLVIPVYFQTEAYMRTLWKRNGELTSEQRINELVRLRKTRQRVVTKPAAPKIRAVVHEAALRLPVGGPEVMREQLSALARACELPNVEIQVQATEAGAFPGIETTFTLLRFGDGAAKDVAQVAGYDEPFYRDREPGTQVYRDAWDRRRVAALDLQESKDRILEAAADFGLSRA